LKGLNNIEFVKYISKPVNGDTINIIYQNNNVNFDRVNLYLDFTTSLLVLIFDTYLGDDITDEKLKENHFKWCWDKNIENFKKENIDFSKNDELLDYFSDFVSEVFYKLNDKEDNPYIYENILNLWKYIFDHKTIKSRADIDSFIEIYNIFDKSLEKGTKKSNLT
jgi:hypothetical protein